jgi:hypothetical protein
MSRYINLSILALLILCATGCSEVYYPKVISNNDLLVVDGLITNASGPFVIKLSKAAKYGSGSVSSPDPVSNAKLTIFDNNGSYPLTETSQGEYTTPPSFVTKIGNSYKLQIQTENGDLYESDSQQLLTPQSYDSIKSYYTTEKYLNPDKSLQTLTGADVRINLSNANSSNKIKCRFTTNLTVEYRYFIEPTPPSENSIYKPDISYCIEYQCFGWLKDLSIEKNVNITDESSMSSDNSVLNHKIGFIPFNLFVYHDDGKLKFVPKEASLYFYLKVNQYTLNDATYSFYKAAKGQLNSTGKIFDPIASQLYSNIKCINNPSKIALGFFEASSVVTTAFFILNWDETAPIYKVANIDLPPSTLVKNKHWVCHGMPPSDFYLGNIPYPSWWGHGIL